MMTFLFHYTFFGSICTRNPIIHTTIKTLLVFLRTRFFQNEGANKYVKM